MSDESKSFEKKLDRDFLIYLNLTKSLFGNIKNDTEKQICEVWLTHLVGKTICSVSEKCDRNIFLSRLLLQMQNGKLKDTFLETPPSGALPCAFTTFGLPTEVDGLKGYEEMGFQIDSSVGGGGSGDFLESSRDGRTYLATRHLPQGMMAFMAVTSNDGEDIWTAQQCLPERPALTENRVNVSANNTGGFAKRLAQFLRVPISQLRKTPEEREKVLEWMDQIINDCNKWIQGEDPHNMELETLFELLYEDYKQDYEKAELLKHPRKVRTLLIRDIRDRISEKRAEVTKRELILDQYEAEEYFEEATSKEYLDDVWLQCAKKPMSESVRANLEATYPPEVVQRFFELLFLERIDIIERGEKEAKRKIAELRKGSLEDIKKELHKLKKVQDEYKEYYCIYKDVEKKACEYEKEWKEKCSKLEKPEQQENIEKSKREIESEIKQTKQRFDKERKIQNELSEKLEEAKEAYRRLKERMCLEGEKLNCELSQVRSQMEDLVNQICTQKRKREDLRRKLMCKKNEYR